VGGGIEIAHRCPKRTEKGGMTMNKVVLVGRVAGEVRVTKLPSGTVVARVDLAYNRKYKDKNGQWQESVDFFEIEAFGKTALRLQDLAQKGNLILVDGRLTQATWEKDGKKQNKVRVRAVKLQLLAKPKKTEVNTKQQEKAIEEEVIAF
jgi:single-strand DNA-binding protein